ncbi:MAG: ABC transporter permease [Thermoanaerobaculia bacterium]
MILSVLRSSWMQLKRDRPALALSFVVPIVFFSIFAAIFGAQRRSTTNKVTLLVVDEDGSQRSRRLAAGLESETALRVRRAPEAKAGQSAVAAYDRASAEAAVKQGEAPVALVIERGFAEAKLAFGSRATTASTHLLLLADGADPVAPQIVQGMLQKVAFTALPDTFLAGGIEALDEVAGFDATQREKLAGLVEMIGRAPGAGSTTSAGVGAAHLDAGMPLAVETRDLLGAGKKNPIVAFYAAALGVMFLLFTASGAGGALIEERENGTLDRLLSTRLSMGQLLGGKLTYLTTLGFSQLLVMFLWGAAVFQLELLPHLAGFFAMAIPTALATSSFGLVLAALCRTRSQLAAITNLVVLPISALGGSMFPRFLMPEGLQKASLVAFNSWAIEGFQKIFWREQGLASIWPEVLVLLATAVVFFALARRLARKWEIV